MFMLITSNDLVKFHPVLNPENNSILLFGTYEEAGDYIIKWLHVFEKTKLTRVISIEQAYRDEDFIFGKRREYEDE